MAGNIDSKLRAHGTCIVDMRLKVILRTVMVSGGNPVVPSVEGVVIGLAPFFCVMGTCLKGGCSSVAFEFEWWF